MTQQNSWRNRAAALVDSVADLEVPGHPPPGGKGTPAHHHLFDEYVAELGEAMESARGWWAALVAVEQTRGATAEEAGDTARERHPGGPPSDKTVVAAVRKAWLACDALNAAADPSARVRPEELVMTWLQRERRLELAEFLSGLAYWPVGLDRQLKWV
jgi:hypothetical protein